MRGIKSTAMKSTMIAMIMIAMTTVANAQPSANLTPDGFAAGTITLANNTTINGSIKENIRKKGEIVLMTDGKKTKYKASDIISTQLGGTTYTTSNATFYEILFSGKSITLLRKASEAAGVQFNGSEAVVVTSEGDIDDLFIKKAPGGLQLLTKKNAKELLGDCAGAIEKLDAETAKTLLASCDNAK